MDPVLQDLLDFLEASPTPMHAVASATARLTGAGFRALSETDSWEGLEAGRYLVSIGGTSLVALVVPSKKHDGFRIVGAHTDSPNLRLKPRPDYTKEGYAQVGVEVYGGALLNSWLDRDLSLAGRATVLVDGATETRLVRIRRPIARVAQLAIHLDRDVNDKLALNRQEHLAPLLGLASEAAPVSVAALVAAELGVDSAAVVGHELMLYDTLGPAVGGAGAELLFSARLDNLAMCHAGVTAIAEAARAGSTDGDFAQVVALFDHEEIGSESVYGAHSAFLPRVLERVSLGRGLSREGHLRALARSACVSADMAHAVHPNYPDRHEPRHKPRLNEGPVVKVNSQQRYATSASTAAMFAALCKSADVPVQHYAHRTDLPCGSTIGPIASTLLGIPTVDVGNPMLSMHSAREMAGTLDPALMTRVLGRFFAA
jgi:aspartyl aminopeptidase